MTGPGTHSLRIAREAVGLTRAELAQGAGCSARFVEAVERGECDASPAMWERCERALLRAALARVDRIEDAVAACTRLDRAAHDVNDGAGVL